MTPARRAALFTLFSASFTAGAFFAGVAKTTDERVGIVISSAVLALMSLFVTLAFIGREVQAAQEADRKARIAALYGRDGPPENLQ